MGAGKHLFQMTSWAASGRWYVNDVKNLGGKSAKWFTPMRVLDLSIEDYIDLLRNTFHAKEFHYYSDTDFLNFCFSNEKDAKAFCSYVNKIAKRKNYCCE